MSLPWSRAARQWYSLALQYHAALDLVQAEADLLRANCVEAEENVKAQQGALDDLTAECVGVEKELDAARAEVERLVRAVAALQLAVSEKIAEGGAALRREGELREALRGLTEAVLAAAENFRPGIDRPLAVALDAARAALEPELHCEAGY